MDKKVERIINLYNRLAEGEVLNKADEAARFEVNERSIQRDLEDIRAYFANDPESNRELIYDRIQKGYVQDKQIYLEYEDIVKFYDAIMKFMDKAFRLVPKATD